MVASLLASPTLPKLTRRKLAFARAIAQGATQARAYELACPGRVTASTAQSMGSKWAALPAVKEKVNELLSLADAATHLRISERRSLLAETAREQPNRPPTHSERIAAIKADAELSGDLVQTGPVVSINFSSALNQVRQTFAPTIELDTLLPKPLTTPAGVSPLTPPPSSSIPVAGTGGAPNSDAGLVAMGGHKLHKQSGPFFTIDSPFDQEQFQIPQNPAQGVFYNELGEEEAL